MRNLSCPLPPSELACAPTPFEPVVAAGSTARENHSGAFTFIAELVARGGPAPAEYPLLDALMKRLPELSAVELECLRAEFRDSLNTTETMQGFAYLKPHGYAGDFEIIDRIYQERVSSDPQLSAWDRYFHAQSATRAVRNRKSYFHALLDRCLALGRPFRVLNIASGSGRCMAEWLTAHPEAPVEFDCVELDTAAIAHARELSRPFPGRVNFIQQNALRFMPAQGYELIWAAGICDYFTDPIFARLLRRLLPAIAPGGELVVGNFSETNSTRNYMETLGEWQLHHRSAETLRQIATSAGAPASAISVGAEAEGINLFLHIAATSGQP